jgi:hypothetical protein
MATSSTSATSRFVEAIVARDFALAQSLLHPEIDFRGMTPSRVWEADAPAGVEEVLHAWFEHPDREIAAIDATEPATVEDTMRVGWRVRGNRADGAFSFEQQAYARERDGKIAWLRVMCSGPRPA